MSKSTNTNQQNGNSIHCHNEKKQQIQNFKQYKFDQSIQYFGKKLRLAIDTRIIVNLKYAEMIQIIHL